MTSVFGGADTAPTNGLLGRQVIQNWPTPDANTSTYSNGQRGPNLREAAVSQSSPPDPAQPNSGRICWCGIPNCDQPSHKRRLNRLFTVWMMWLARTLAGSRTDQLRACGNGVVAPVPGALRLTMLVWRAKD